MSEHQQVPEVAKARLSFEIHDKPNMRFMIRKDPEAFRQFMRTWIDTAESLFGIGFPVEIINDTADQLRITPSELVGGIIAGCLNEQFVNEKMAPVLGKELLPVALLTLKGQMWTGEDAYFDWRRWYRMTRRDEVNADTIAKIIGNIMKYARFLDFDKLSEALETNQLILFKSLADEQVKLLPYYPALRYQHDHMGEFHVGKFMPERNAGFFDCGTIEPDETHCPACGRRDLTKSKDEKHIYCRACNAGYKPKLKGELSDDRQV